MQLQGIANKTYVFQIPFQPPLIFFNDPKIVEHVTKIKFHIYDKVSISVTKLKLFLMIIVGAVIQIKGI